MIAFTMHASAYAPSSHLVFHSLWQVGMSLGTVMTDSLCLPKVRLEKPTLAASLWSKIEKQGKKNKNKKTAHVQSFEPCIKFSMEQQIICLSDVRIPSGDHQAIPLLFSKSIYTPLMKEAPVPFICHVSHKQWESEKGWTLGHLRVSLLYICDKVRSCGWDIVLWKSLITFERLMMKLWAKERKITICGKKPDLSPIM